MNITIGNMVTLSTTTALRDPVTGVSTPTDDLGLQILLTAPDGSHPTAAIVHDGLGQYHVSFLPTIKGPWSWRWLGDSSVQGASEGTFQVISLYVGPVTDLRDLRVLVPACRRAIDGPSATSADAVSTTVDDQGVLGLLADATADLILLTHGESAFGYQLVVSARDPFYSAPIAWATDAQRAPAADAAIVMQSALNFYFEKLKNFKVSETIKDEAQEWTYEFSASLLRDQLKYLIDNRDKALASLQIINAPLDTYVSLVAERDRMAAAWLEPWVSEIGAPVPYAGGGGSGPLEYDYRFNSWG